MRRRVLNPFQWGGCLAIAIDEKVRPDAPRPNPSADETGTPHPALNSALTEPISSTIARNGAQCSRGVAMPALA